MVGYGGSLLAQSSSARRRAAVAEAARVDSIRRDSLRLDSVRLLGLRVDSVRRDSIRRDSAIEARLRAKIEREEAALEDTDGPIDFEALVPSSALIRGSDSLRGSGIAVLFKGDTLFRVYRNVGAFSPAQRARIVSGQILDLAKLPRRELDSLRVVEGEDGSFNVVYQDRVINSVSALDAAILDTTAVAVAQRNRDIITAALVRDYVTIQVLTTPSAGFLDLVAQPKGRWLA